MATPFESFVQTELPLRPVMLTVDNTGYSGDPNDSGAPAMIKSAPKGTFYLQSTGNALWKKNDPGAGNWGAVAGSGGGGVTVYATEVALLAATPANSTIGYATDTNTFWYRRSAVWSKASSTDIATLSGTQSFAGDKTFSGALKSPGVGGATTFKAGASAVASMSGSIAIGSLATATGLTDSVAIGSNTLCNSQGAVTIGLSANCYSAKQSPVAIGPYAASLTDYSVAIGYTARTQDAASNSIAVGRLATTKTAQSIAIGDGAGPWPGRPGGVAAITIGATAQTIEPATNGIVIGNSSKIFNGGYPVNDCSGAIVIGSSAQAAALNAIAIGTSATFPFPPSGTYPSVGAILIGASSTMDIRSSYSVVIGYQALTDDGGTSVDTSGSVVIGYSAQSKGVSAIAIGRDAHADYANSLALGEGAAPTGANKGEVGSASKLIDVNFNGKLSMTGNTFRVATARTITNANDPGNAGEVCWDANYLYVCVASGTWKRTALSTWP